MTDNYAQTDDIKSQMDIRASEKTPYILLHPHFLQALQAEIAAAYGGRLGLREATPIKLLHAKARALSEIGSCDLADLCACYAYGITVEQLFIDNNAKVALCAVESLLYLNGHYHRVDAVTAFMGYSVLSQGDLNEEAFGAWLRPNIVKLKRPRLIKAV